MPNRRKSMDFEKLIASGEAKNAPDGFRSQTANGTSHARTKGWNREDQKYTRPEAETGGPWQTPNSNRGGE